MTLPPAPSSHPLLARISNRKQASDEYVEGEEKEGTRLLWQSENEVGGGVDGRDEDQEEELARERRGRAFPREKHSDVGDQDEDEDEREAGLRGEGGAGHKLLRACCAMSGTDIANP
eukprot:3236824-Rhodomonas_salina.2